MSHRGISHIGLSTLDLGQDPVNFTRTSWALNRSSPT